MGAAGLPAAPGTTVPGAVPAVVAVELDAVAPVAPVVFVPCAPVPCASVPESAVGRPNA
jgi:hypothetical protein